MNSTPEQIDATHAIRIGVVATGNARESRALEDRGVDSLWMGGHLASPNPARKR